MANVFHFMRIKYIFVGDRKALYRTTSKEQINHIINSFKCK